VHALLQASGEKKPYILAGHSMGGIYARQFATKYPLDVAVLLFVDSSHEEQAWRLHEIDPAGPGLSDAVARTGFIITPGERLAWRTEVPLIVLGRGKPFPRSGQLTEEQFAAWDRTWQEMQRDLARRSPKGQYRRAAKRWTLYPE
jgi:pimeloyl-ACP methyl ester carboxylesterase